MKKDGGRAFPVSVDKFQDEYGGMSVRDVYVITAMYSLIMSGRYSYSAVADAASEIADRLISKRE